MAEPNTVQGCELVGSGCIMATSERDQNQFTLMTFCVPCGLRGLEKTVSYDVGKNSSSSLMAPCCFGGAHFDEQTWNANSRPVMGDFQREVKALNEGIIGGSLQQHLPPWRKASRRQWGRTTMAAVWTLFIEW